jgi:arylsulfatase A-like enzyme
VVLKRRVNKTVSAVVAAAISLSVASCGPWRSSGPLNVLFIVVDTLRADHVGCYGYDEVDTANIDDLASRGARFRTVVTSAPVTAPSVATLVTSTFPCFHGVRDNEFFSMNTDLPSLASIFRAAGYETAGFVGSAVLDRRYGFGEGFDHYDDDMSAEFPVYDGSYLPQTDELQGTQRRAERVTDAALRWIKKHGKDGPFFCFVHYFDPHDPYDPPPPFGGRYPDSPYDGEIAYTDEQIGRLTHEVEELSPHGDLLIVLTADHGEGLGEHGERTHGFFLYDSTVLVPLVFHLPDVISPNTILESQVRTADVMPTILDLAGLPVPETAQGVSLASALRGEEDLRDRNAYVETFHTLYSYEWHELQAVRTPDWKYVRAPEAELYDLRADPGEKQNLFRVKPEAASELEASFAVLEERLKAGSEPYRAFRSERDDEMAAKMRVLGYVGESSRRGEDLPSPGGDYPDPKSRIARLNDRQEAGGHLRLAAGLMLKGEFEAALEKVEEARRAAPDYAEVQATEGLILVRKGDIEEGIELLETALERDPRAQMAHQTLNNLGLAYLERGECEKAIEALEKSLKARRDYYNALYNLGLAHERCGDPGRAVRAYEAFLRRNPDLDPEFQRSVRARIERLTPSQGEGD